MREILEPDQMYVTIDLLILTVREGRLCLLLSRRKNPPYAGQWALPGRFVGLEESAEAAVRELMAEMLPVEDAFFEQLYTFTAVNRDPRGRIISAAYLVIVPWQKLASLPGWRERGLGCFQVATEGGALLLTGPEGAELAAPELAFDHGHIIGIGIQRLRGKIDYTDIGFRFLRDTRAFSLAELQTVFEAVLGRAMDSSNFRRFIRSRYEEKGRMKQTDQAQKSGRGRPAALYSLSE